jgi:hypothetical protein
MNIQRTHGDNDSTLDQGLDELSRTYSELKQDTPPDLLDQAILNRARREVERKTGWMQFGWLHGLTTAAVVVLAFSIVLQQREPVTVEEGIMLESSPPVIRGEPVRADRMQQAVPTAAMKLEPEEAADSDLDTREYSESRKEAQVLANVAGAPAAVRELQVSLEEEQAPHARAKAPAVGETGFAAATMPTESDDEDALQDMIPAEQQLAEILRLKNEGDESWKKALDDFQQQYPDYPLPEELQD